jgi:dodecin
MPNSVYKKLELVGTSPSSISEAINNAISTASGEVENITWFEVSELRGHVEKGQVTQYQVILKVGYRISP